MNLPVSSYLSSYSKRQNSALGTNITLLALIYTSFEEWEEWEDTFYDGEEFSWHCCSS